MSEERRKPAVFGTKEWAKHSADISFGCPHGCKYCYACAEAVRSGNAKTPDDWRKASVHSPAGVARLQRLLGTPDTGRIMFPAHHDIVPSNFSLCVAALDVMLRHGNEVLIVTKPHLGLVTEMCQIFDAYRDKILWRLTIGTIDEEVATFWEPNAPVPLERVRVLQQLFDNGWRTSISCEPMLDNFVEDVVTACGAAVTDAIWIGLPNFLPERLLANGYAEDSIEMTKARDLLAALSPERVKEIYAKYKDDEHVRWKESIKQIVGLPLSETPGLDR